MFCQPGLDLRHGIGRLMRSQNDAGAGTVQWVAVQQGRTPDVVSDPTGSVVTSTWLFCNMVQQCRSEFAMAAGTVSLRYFVLGLLTQQSMSGYDIKRSLKGLSWLIGCPSGGSLYPVLRVLRQEDLVTVEIVPGLDRPPRKIYSITEAGHQALQAWIEQPISANAPLRAFVMRLLLADSHSPSRLSAHLQQRRAQVATQHATLVGGLGAAASRLNLGQQMALDYGLALATAELAWLDTTLDRLREQQSPEEEVQSVSKASAV